MMCWLFRHRWQESSRTEFRIYSRDGQWMRTDQRVRYVCARCGAEKVETVSTGEFREWNL